MRRRAGLRGALRPPTRASGGGGERPRVAVSPRPPQVTRCPPAPSLLLLPRTATPSRALTSLARPGPDQLAPQRRELLDGAVAGDTSGTTRDGQRRRGARRVEAQVYRRMRGAWHRPRPPSPAGCRGGARRGGQVSRGPRSGVMGCQRPRAHGEGAVSTHPSGQGSGP